MNKNSQLGPFSSVPFLNKPCWGDPDASICQSLCKSFFQAIYRAFSTPGTTSQRALSQRALSQRALSQRALSCWLVSAAMISTCGLARVSNGQEIDSGSVVANADTSDASHVRDSWPRFLGKTYDGVVPASSQPDLKIDWTAQPKLLWQLAVDDGYGIGSVDADGNYYHFDSPQGTAERLRCIDMKTGAVRWTQTQELAYRDMYGYETGPRGSATLVDDKVVTMGVGGQLTCRSRADGALIWSVDTSEKYGVVTNFFGVGGSPLVLGDLVIVMVGGSPAEDQKIAPGRLDRVSPNGSAMVAFRIKDGTEVWKCGDDLASYSSPRPIKVGGQTLVLLFARDHLLAVDPAQGNVRWKHFHRAEINESVNAMVPIVDRDLVFISECYELGSVLLKVTGQSAKVQWEDPANNRRKQAMRVHWSNPILVDGHLYGCSGRNAPDSDFRCVEFETGKVKWQDSRRIRSSVTAVDNHLLVLEERGLVQVVRPNRDKLDVVTEWDFHDAQDEWPRLNYPCWAAPVVVGNQLLIRGNTKVLCLALQTL
ncbi:PQQ-binding-like beta-propeller repeat protein [Stieleria marina]|uniref:Outer membrane protein assembly factor BamB n=1 Tax=Stieleria marina TaxID=1930275 RepID=A0A517NYG9_9BACT|nr:Outer membrane protein assembly factor BamB [Planctomycetes bacterium K23_9]